MAKFKYIRKELVNGKMRYYYEEPGAKANLPTSKTQPNFQKKTLQNQRGMLKEAPDGLAEVKKATSGAISEEEYYKEIGMDDFVAKTKQKYADGNTHERTAQELKSYRDELNGIASEKEIKELDDLAATALEYAKKYDTHKNNYKKTEDYLEAKRADANKSRSITYKAKYIELYESLKKKYKTKVAARTVVRKVTGNGK